MRVWGVPLPVLVGVAALGGAAGEATYLTWGTTAWVCFTVCMPVVGAAAGWAWATYDARRRR